MLESAEWFESVFRESHRCFLHHILSWSAGVQSHKHCLSHFPAGELLPFHFVPQEPECSVTGHCRNYIQNVAPAMGKASSIFQVCLWTQGSQRVSPEAVPPLLPVPVGWPTGKPLPHRFVILLVSCAEEVQELESFCWCIIGKLVRGGLY